MRHTLQSLAAPKGLSSMRRAGRRARRPAGGSLRAAGRRREHPRVLRQDRPRLSPRRPRANRRRARRLRQRRARAPRHVCGDLVGPWNDCRDRGNVWVCDAQHGALLGFRDAFRSMRWARLQSECHLAVPAARAITARLSLCSLPCSPVIADFRRSTDGMRIAHGRATLRRPRVVSSAAEEPPPTGVLS